MNKINSCPHRPDLTLLITYFRSQTTREDPPCTISYRCNWKWDMYPLQPFPMDFLYSRHCHYKSFYVSLHVGFDDPLNNRSQSDTLSKRQSDSPLPSSSLHKGHKSCVQTEGVDSFGANCLALFFDLLE